MASGYRELFLQWRAYIRATVLALLGSAYRGMVCKVFPVRLTYRSDILASGLLYQYHQPLHTVQGVWHLYTHDLTLSKYYSVCLNVIAEKRWKNSVDNEEAFYLYTCLWYRTVSVRNWNPSKIRICGFEIGVLNLCSIYSYKREQCLEVLSSLKRAWTINSKGNIPIYGISSVRTYCYTYEDKLILMD